MKLKLFLLTFFFTCFVQAQTEHQYYNDVKEFSIQDSINPPQNNMVLFIGSSSFTLWKTVNKDLENNRILNRAFGGSTLLDLLHYKNDILLKYNPNKIVIYCGENDIANSEKVSGKIVFQRFKKLYSVLRNQFPDVPVVYVSMKPSILRWEMRDRMIDGNKRIEKFLKQKKKATFVSIWNNMLDNNIPKQDIYLDDNLHMNSKGYKIWIEILKPLVNN